ncbi:MAG: hypothetical protein ABEK17_00535 [Candidatus Aenigmatarchaeota archaeon]
MDTTWDPRFVEYGFTVGEWSRKGTEIAVDPINQGERCDGVEEADRYMSRTKKPKSERGKKFSRRKNKWIESLEMK